MQAALLWGADIDKYTDPIAHGDHSEIGGRDGKGFVMTLAWLYLQYGGNDVNIWDHCKRGSWGAGQENWRSPTAQWHGYQHRPSGGGVTVTEKVINHTGATVWQLCLKGDGWEDKEKATHPGEDDKTNTV